MREVKFRGKCLESGTWIYGSLFNSIWRKSADGSRVCYIFPDNMLEFNTWIGDNWEDFSLAAEKFEVDPATVGQYTGIKDKNGKEIYEGDILTDEYKSIGTIEWVNGEFVVCFGDVGMYSLSNYFDGSCQMGIIGNIHDNPELIKSE